MGWDSERLSSLPKVTKLIQAAEPQATPALKGWGHRLRTWGRLSTSPSLARDLDEQITPPVEQPGREERQTLAFH